MSNRNPSAIALILPADDPWPADDPRARDARLDQQLAYLERIAQRARRRAAARALAGNGGRPRDIDDAEDDEDESVYEPEDADTELKPRNGRLC